jgi:myo-inositol-1(or 4)-monophosphatase
MTADRYAVAKAIAKDAGRMALDYFRDISALEVTSKGAQDHVSNADLEVETFVRAQIAKQFPQDGIVGEEHENVASSSGWTWVIDPIDGTANFICGIPQWCVILACVQDDETKIGVIYEPSADELFCAAAGKGSFLNEKPISVAKSKGLNDGSVGVGMNGRTATHMASRLIADLSTRGGVFFRNASGGLMLAYVAAGRLIGYTEAHMNAWDCLAGQLMVAEAGGQIEPQSAGAMLIDGGRVIAACPDIYEELLSISATAFTP